MQLVQSNNATRGPSEVVSRYLEAIYYMWSENEPLRSARLADWLGLSPPAVPVSLRRNTPHGLGRVNGRQEIEVTAPGMRPRGSIARRPPITVAVLADGPRPAMVEGH